MNTQWIVVSGNISDGCEFIGPFPDYDDALAWAEGMPRGSDWHVVALQAPG